MAAVRGIVLVMALIFLLVMTLLVSAMLLVSQLSHKAAFSGQQQLQLSHQALQQHMQQIPQLADAAIAPNELLTTCPAEYAAWSVGSLTCEVLQLDTDVYSDNRYFYASYSSVVLRKTVVENEE
ncbi:hypothetical protein [Rheinheimera metallidurans]|uniref:hypothetical protein n=1 Tax=Rheinheimera metallidurans TaxID=2925781 RepID=UPI00300143F7